jgi:hypothetical protein
MTLSTLIVRETLISVVINSAISVGVCLLLFGLDRPVPASALGWDFLPQSFMIALMGTVVPALMLRRRLGASVARIVMCAVAMAIGALLPGNVASVLTHMLVEASVPARNALLIKAGYGAALAAVVTPIALIALARKSGSQI